MRALFQFKVLALDNNNLEIPKKLLEGSRMNVAITTLFVNSIRYALTSAAILKKEAIVKVCVGLRSFESFTKELTTQ